MIITARVGAAAVQPLSLRLRRSMWVRPPVVVVQPAPPPVVIAPAPVLYNPAQPYVRVRCNNAAITGTVIGGVAGGLIGAQFGHGRHRGFPIVGGTLIGALIGNQIGQGE